MLSILAILVIATLVFFHGQGGSGIFPIRVISTGCVALIIGVITFRLTGVFWYAAASALSAGFAFCWGPEIGWDQSVLRTQILKGAWLTASLFPIGLFYAALRPLAYWIGYTKFESNQDEIARTISGVSLGVACVAAYWATGAHAVIVNIATKILF